MTDVPYIYIYTYIHIYIYHILRALLYRLCGARSGSPQLKVQLLHSSRTTRCTRVHQTLSLALAVIRGCGLRDYTVPIHVGHAFSFCLLKNLQFIGNTLSKHSLASIITNGTVDKVNFKLFAVGQKITYCQTIGRVEPDAL